MWKFQLLFRSFSFSNKIYTLKGNILPTVHVKSIVLKTMKYICLRNKRNLGQSNKNNLQFVFFCGMLCLLVVVQQQELCKGSHIQLFLLLIIVYKRKIIGSRGEIYIIYFRNIIVMKTIQKYTLTMGKNINLRSISCQKIVF